MKIIRLQILSLILACSTFNVHSAPLVRNYDGSSQPADRCRTVHWKSGDINFIDAQLYKQSHITLPEASIDVIMGDKELWTIDWVNNHIFIKPGTAAEFGKETTLSAIGASGNAYEFLVRRLPSGTPMSHCVTLTTEGPMISRGAWEKTNAIGAVDPGQKQTVDALNQRLTDQQVAADREKRELEKTLEKQGKDALRKYRKKIYTNYAWNSGSGFFGSGTQIESVYDDGRFTYVSLKNDSTGLMSMTANIDGNKELLEFSYDAATKVYQINGIFPKFNMRAGDSEIIITRKQPRE